MRFKNMNFNRNNYNPNIWDVSRNPFPPFGNNQQNFNQNSGNFQNPFPHYFPQQQNHSPGIRPLLSLPGGETTPPNFRKYNNNNNSDYRRPGPACRTIGRNNHQGNNSNWMKNNSNFKNRDQQRGNKKPWQDQNDSQQNPTSSSEDNHSAPKFKSLVDHLKAVANAKKSDGSAQGDNSTNEIDAMCAKNASEASKKLLRQLKTMDKDSVRDLIKNPKQPYKKKVLNIQAREKLREQMRKKLHKLGESGEYQIEPDECIDFEKIPESLIAQIGKTIDLHPEIDVDMELSESISEELIKDIEVVTTNLGDDFFKGSEMLLFNGVNLLGDADTEHDIKIYDNGSRFPPLPVEPPPSPPPQPVPPPTKPESEAAFTSVEKPWSPVRNNNNNNDQQSFTEDTWDDFDSARNPDPPAPVQVIAPSTKPPVVDIEPVSRPLPKPINDSTNISATRSIQALCPIPTKDDDDDDEWDRPQKTPQKTVVETASDVKQAEFSTETVATNEQSSEVKLMNDTTQRANETYGEYRRRLATQQAQDVDAEVPGKEVINNENPQHSQNNQNQRKDWMNNENNSGRNSRNDNWNKNNQNNRNNRQQNRNSRFDTPRGRDRNPNNYQQQRHLSRDTNNSFDSGRNEKFDDIRDAHNYRFQNESGRDGPNIDRLNTILNPKPLNFKGSFNKRTQNSNNWNGSQRSRSRNRTPANNSMERDFDVNLLPSPNDARPCFTTLKKVMEIDASIAKLHDKILGIDKVISNLQLERVGYQKTFSNLQHDRKILFDNMIKRAMSSNADESNESHEVTTEQASQKSQIEKKLQNIVDQKKRKQDDHQEEPKKKKQNVDNVETTTSAAAKAAKLQKEKEEEERRQSLLEKKRLKKLRREREEAEKRRLEEKIIREAEASKKVTIKQEPVEKSNNNKSSKHHHQHHSSGKSQKVVVKSEDEPPTKNVFKSTDVIDPKNHKMKNCSVKLQRVSLPQTLIDAFSLNGFLTISADDWNKWTKDDQVKTEDDQRVVKETEKKEEKDEEKPQVAESEEKDPLAETNSSEPSAVDPLAVDENTMNPPTPGSNVASNDDSLLVEMKTEIDYSEWAGDFTAHEQPIVHLQNVEKKFIVAACEDGKVLKYHTKDGKLVSVFSKHKGICNSFLYDGRGYILTVSSDGFLHKIKFKTFQLVSSENFNEPLQVIEKSKQDVFVGTKSGKIFRLKRDLIERESEPICELGVLILCLRATKEGSRNILLVSSRSHAIQVRDAQDGLLLRTFADNLAGVSIYDMLIEGSTIYCGSNRNEIFAIDFTTGALKKSRPCGAGAICVKLYKHFIIAACYDGNIYIINTKNDDAAVNICGPSNMLLAMDLWDDKIIASTKDKTLKIMNIPT
ncbi:CLUMA_CG005154, isoform A [Clunio marinus]|uniref:CLUMA_CG005154, isoform A n=1 Tax=Clunio marinus TaxID=568069 RepID=A0A1J1HTU2_9DIPT|nr:CLUMA_CG005154, isoform A [Clunio marinus]